VDIRRHDERFKTRVSWLDSKHSFSFSRHYDPSNTHHGLLLGNNNDVVFTAGGQQVTATEPAEILVWEMHATLT
jgi:hypothetical protein